MADHPGLIFIQDGWIQISYEQFMTIVLNAP